MSGGTGNVAYGSFLQALQQIYIYLGNGVQAIKGLTVINGLLTHQAQGTDGLFAAALPLLDFRNSDGSALAAAASAGKFGYSVTLGTSFAMVGEAALSNTKTDDAIVEVVLPPWFISGSGITVTVNAALSGAGVAGTHTAKIKAFLTTTAGVQGADIGPGVASNITAAGADITFAVAGATLNPGNRLVLELETVLQETGGASTISALINSVRIT